MYRYILKRLLFLIPTVLGVTLIIFAVMNITPGNPGRMILGANANAAEVEAVNQELGFYDPVLVRWARYLKNVFTQGDFGNVAVMYAGEIIEMGSAEDIFTRPIHHPYTDGLFGSLPNLKEKTDRLHPIAGLMPDPTNLPKGCKFAPRCDKCMEICKEVPPEVYVDGTHSIRCHLYCQKKED